MTRPRLCITVSAATTAELRRRRDAVKDADLVELRLDSVADPNVAGALAGRRRGVIVTCRPSWEGGGFTGSEETRRKLLGEALALGAEYVDIEWRAGFADLLGQTGGRRIVLSSHDFASVPADLADRARTMRGTGAEMIKLAVTATRLSDCIPLTALGAAMGGDGGLTLIAMGPHGLITRVLPWRFSSAWSYAGSLSTVGQLTPETLLEEYRFRSLSDMTAIYGLVGSPIDHSVSPAMHNAAIRAARLDAVYLPLPAADAGDFMTFARAMGLKGASVTIPFKVSLFDQVDEVYAVARRIGAIYTIRATDGRWIGGNTDAAGFIQPLQERAVPIEGIRAAVLGAGGAARAVAVALAPGGAEVTIYARQLARAQETAMTVGARAALWPPPKGSWDLLVNCTPIGMYPRLDDTPLGPSELTGRFVYDLVYNPPQTRLLREAATAGCATLGGLDMLVAQAQEQFQWWMGTRAPAGVMRAAAERRLAEFITDDNHVV
jgi:3-dehydroquinate dehydratase/shikimate dehydrogenase